MLASLDTVIGFSVFMLGISLLITILNQIVSALLAHRGSNLRWGLEVLFKQLDPNETGYPLLAAQARDIAEIVLTHPLVSDSIFSTKWSELVVRKPRMLALVKRWRLANGIQPDELSTVLTQIVKVRPAGMSKNLHAALRREVTQLLNVPSPAAVRDATLSTAIAAGVVSASFTGKVIGNSPCSSGNLEEVFGKVMDRVRQRFTTWMRIWTVGFAFTIAGLGCVDSIALISALYSNSSLRTQLVNAASQTTSAAAKLTPDPSQMFTDALRKASIPSVGAPPMPATVNTLAQGNVWIEHAFADPVARQKAKDAFSTAVQADLTDQATAAGQILSAFSASGLPKFGFSEWRSPRQHPWQIPGVFITALLLSLGAPFWFNTLKSLTSLRPLLAGPSSSQQQTKAPSEEE